MKSVTGPQTNRKINNTKKDLERRKKKIGVFNWHSKWNQCNHIKKFFKSQIGNPNIRIGNPQ